MSNHNDLPVFSRDIPAAAASNEVDKEVFPMPQWKCFCCCDTGFVCCPEVDRIVPGYRWNVDRPILCQNPKCFEGPKFRELSEFFDLRFNGALCQKLHRLNYEDWLETRRQWHEQKQQGVNVVSQDMAAINEKIVNLFGRSERTANDEREIAQRKEQIHSELNF